MKWLLISFFFLCLVPLACDSNAGPQRPSAAAQAQDARVEGQIDKYDAQLKKAEEQIARADAAAKRYDAILSKWEEQAARFDRILDRWEKILTRLEENPPNPASSDEAKRKETGITPPPGG